MALAFAPGDDLVFQLESGYGLLRVLRVDTDETSGAPLAWHLLAYEQLFPDVDAAEAALAAGNLQPRAAHMALTDHALEKTPAAKLGNRPVTDEELKPYRDWLARGGRVSEVSVLLTLGLR